MRLGDGRRCEPLTLADGYSRYLLALSADGGTAAAEARPVLERAFRTYGLPEAKVSPQQRIYGLTARLRLRPGRHERLARAAAWITGRLIASREDCTTGRPCP